MQNVVMVMIYYERSHTYLLFIFIYYNFGNFKTKVQHTKSWLEAMTARAQQKWRALTPERWVCPAMALQSEQYIKRVHHKKLYCTVIILY